jgi:hypothetical protein
MIATSPVLSLGKSYPWISKVCIYLSKALAAEFTAGHRVGITQALSYLVAAYYLDPLVGKRLRLSSVCLTTYLGTRIAIRDASTTYRP